MVAQSFRPIFEVSAYTVAVIVGLQTTVAFGNRYLNKKRAPLNLTAFLAAALTLFYSLYGYVYWLHGMEGYNCLSLQVINGMCLSSSNALCFVHLFLKAEASNKMNPKWKNWRVVGIATTLFNWITLVVVHSLMTAEPRRNPALSGEMRCVWTFEENSFKLKWYAQLIQHVLMASLFCWPLLEHMARMRQNAIKGSSSTHSVYSSLVIRAVAAMLVSTTFCAIISALALARIEDPTLEVPSYSLAILDNAITLASIFYAMNISTAPEEDKSYKVALTSVNSNTASHRSSSFSAPHSSSVQAQV